jgi:hypothetical protein
MFDKRQTAKTGISSLQQSKDEKEAFLISVFFVFQAAKNCAKVQRTSGFVSGLPDGIFSNQKYQVG